MPVRLQPARYALILLMPALLLLSACDRDDHDDHEHFISVDRVEILDRDTGDLYAFWQSGMSTFDTDSMPIVRVNDEIALDVAFLDHQGNEPDLGGEYSLNAWINTDAPADVIELSVREDHVVLFGAGVGTTEVVFDLAHGNHSDFTSVPMQVNVDNVPAPGNPNVPTLNTNP